MIQRRQEFLEWLRSIERKWQSIWREKRLFEANVEEGKPKYFITVPYPYANGPLHIGHGRTYTIGDIVARYKRLRGLNVLYPMAFHITGTPIVAFSDMISRGDYKTVALYREYVKFYVEDEKKVDEVVESFNDPLRLATFFAEKIQRDFEELGYSIDWRRKFHTGEPIYSRFITWQYYRLFEKGLITRGDHIVTYCLLHNQPEGEDDIQDADVNPVEIIEYTAVKFKLIETGEYLLAGTLRPETLFGVTNIWVNPDAKYVVFEWNGDRCIASNKALIKLVHQHPGDDIKIIKEIEGKDLIGMWAESPLGDRVIVLPALFVDPDNATGVVYSEPSDAPYDYVALMELKSNPHILVKYNVDPSVVLEIEPKKIIEVPGIEGHHSEIAVKRLGISSQLDPRLEDVSREVYKEQFYNGILVVDNREFRGLPVKDARDKVKELLYSGRQGFPFYELNRKAWCRSGGEIIVAKITGQWFINYNVKWLKENARKALEEGKIKIVPAKYKKLFLDTIDWLDKRPCARKRGIGTRLPWSPEWIIESLSDSTIYMAFYTIVHILREHNISEDSLIPEVFDYVFLGKGSVDELSAKSGIPVELLNKMRKEFTYWYPVDHRHTAIPHISNHLTFYVLHHIALFPEEHIPKLISLNETVIREGAKMSKSKGNVIPLRHITTMYSADLFRLYISWAANLDSILDWREAEVEKVVNSMIRFTNIARASSGTTCHEELADVFTEWFINKFYDLLNKATEAIENLDIRQYAQTAFFDVLALVEKYKEMRGESYVCGVKKVLVDWIKVLNPIIPHLTEEINSWLGNGELLSASKWPEGRQLNEEIIVLMDAVEALIEDMRELLRLVKKPRAKIYIIVASPWKREVAKMVLEGAPLREIVNSIRLSYNVRGREALIVNAYNAFKKIEKKFLENIVKTRSEREFDVYRDSVNYIKSKVPEALEILVLWEDEAIRLSIPKADKSLPLKPAIYIE